MSLIDRPFKRRIYPPYGNIGTPYYGGGYFLVTGDYSYDYLNTTTTRIFYYSDRPKGPWKSYTTIIEGDIGGQIYSVAYAEGIWVAVTLDGSVITAPKASGPWTAAANFSSDGWTRWGKYSVVYGDGKWVCSGNGGLIHVTNDPTGVWTTARQEYHDTLEGIAYGDGKWLAVGAQYFDSSLAICTDDLFDTWSHVSEIENEGWTAWLGVDYGNKKWMVSGFYNWYTNNNTEFWQRPKAAASTTSDPMGNWIDVDQSEYFVNYGTGFYRSLGVHNAVRYFDKYWILSGTLTDEEDNNGYKGKIRYALDPEGPWNTIKMPGRPYRYTLPAYSGVKTRDAQASIRVDPITNIGLDNFFGPSLSCTGDGTKFLTQDHDNNYYLRFGKNFKEQTVLQHYGKLSKDGTKALNGSNASRSVKIYSGSTFENEVSLTPPTISNPYPNLTFSDEFGWTRDWTYDTSTIVVGAYNADYSPGSLGGQPGYGAVYVYTDNSLVSPYKIAAPELYRGRGFRFGDAVVISGDGSVIAVRASEETVNGFLRAGAVYLFSGIDYSLIKRVVSSTPETNGYFGWSMALSYDGSVLVVGDSYVNNVGTDIGRFVVYYGINFNQTKTIVPKELEEELYGYIDGGVLSSDGSTLIVSSGYNAIYVFSGRNFNEEAKITVSPKFLESQTGSINLAQWIDCSDSGDVIFMSATGADYPLENGGIVESAGAVFVFKAQNSGPDQWVIGLADGLAIQDSGSDIGGGWDINI